MLGNKSTWPGSPRQRSRDACYGILREKLTCPCLLELIWSYWNEEGMLVQTMNAITRRFQNMRGPLANDPLANLEVDPLRPLNNLIWGWVQDEQHRLSVVRAQLRIRSPLRAAAGRQGGRQRAHGRQPVEVPGGVPHAPEHAARPSSSRTTTRRWWPTASRCSTR